MNIRAGIIDDEPLARQGLRLRLQKMAGVEVIGEAGNAADGLRMIRDKSPELLLLDIQMPGTSGLDMLRKLQRQVRDFSRLPVVVFVTAYDEYALQAFAEQALDYLLKPIDEERLALAIERAREQLQQRRQADQHRRLQKLMRQYRPQQSGDSADMPDWEALQKLAAADRLVFKDGHMTLRLRQQDIRWIEAAGDYMCVQSTETTHVVRATMKSIEGRADPDILQRVHRSSMVNIHCIKSLVPRQNGEYLITMDCGKRLKLSRHYRDKLPLLRGDTMS